MAEKICRQLDKNRFGVKSVHLVGSTLTATAQAGCDIDLLICPAGSDLQKDELVHWLEGWSLCLDEMNFVRTGYKAGGLLDIHFVTDEELAEPGLIEARLNIRIDDMKKMPLGGVS